MSELNLDEARSLSEVFGIIEERKVMLMTCFDPPCTKYDAMKALKRDKIPYPRSSLYPDVDRLHEVDFLEVVEKRLFVKGSLRKRMRLYGISPKGRIAMIIHCRILSSDRKVPKEVRERAKQYLSCFEPIREWPIYLDFLKWHKERRIDLSRARIDIWYLIFTFSMAAGEHPEHITNPILRKSAEEMNRSVKTYEREYRTLLRQTMIPQEGKT